MIKSTLLKRSMSGNVHGKHRRTMKREMLEKKSFEKLGWKKNGDYGQIDRDFLLIYRSLRAVLGISKRTLGAPKWTLGAPKGAQCTLGAPQ